MRRLGISFFLTIVCVLDTSAQQNFSEDKSLFLREVSSRIRGMNTEAANKVAFDFNNAWTGKFTSQQQDQIHKIALRMDEKNYPFNPYMWYYFSYLAFADAQAHLTNDQLDQVLKQNLELVETLKSQAYRNYLLGMNIFMARRLIGWSKNVKVSTDGGSFDFTILDGIGSPMAEESPTNDEPFQEPISNLNEQPTDEVGNQTDQTDPWGDDPWGDQNNDPWADQDGGYDDNWVDNSNAWGYDQVGEVIEEKQERQFYETVEQDYVAAHKAKYLHPVLSGPAIELEDNAMFITTPFDSLKITGVDGYFLLGTRTFAGEKALLEWPKALRSFQGATVNMKQFYLRPDRSEFWTPNASLTFPKLFEGTIAGSLTYQSKSKRSRRPSNYPVFTSFDSNINLIFPMRNVSYRGGIELKGNYLFGASISEKPGKLTLLDNHGNKVIFLAQRFAFLSDSTITSENAKVTFEHGTDTLYHPAVQMKYDIKSRELIIVKKKNNYATPFNSSYFNLNINAEIIKWDLDSSLVDFSIINGKDLIPVTFESKDYFNEVRFSRLEAGFAFHPVITSVYYANKFGTREFVDLELATYFKQDVKQIKGAMRALKKYGFAKYNAETGLVKLLDRAFLYYDASGGKVDYDNIMIPSISPDRPNASWDLDSGKMVVRGVRRFYFTSDFQVYADPDNQEVTLLENRNILFNGMVNAGDFKYRGREYLFDYDGFFVQMDSIDSIQIQINIPDSLRDATGSDKASLSNQINRTSGTLYLNSPENKSGTKIAPQFPDFTSNSEAVVYFDGPEVLNGSYDKSVKFVIPPFESDSLKNEAAISFDGTFNSGGIFPNFAETLKLQPDQSLGFTHQIPESGYKLYGTSAKTYEKIRLSNQGIRGGGKIDFITSTIYSEDFVYYPDSVAAYGTGGIIQAGEANGASYPEAVLGPYRMHWEPRIDSMYLQNIRAPFKFYNATATLDGAVDITSRGVYGSGTMFTRGSRAVSQNLTFEQFSYEARHAQFEILTNNPEKPALAGDDISLNFDLRKNTALIRPEKEGVAAISFPYAQMKTSITNAIWDLEDSVVTMTKPANVPLSSSYFYTTREELDSLAFNAEKAIYDFNSRELNIKGIPFIRVADAFIIPENNETTILENAELQQFNNAQIVIDTLNEYHFLYDGEIKILSRNDFIGSAKYKLITGNKEFAINFNNFSLEDVPIGKNKTQRMTVSGGEVLAKDNLIIAPGFFYKGEVKMFAYKKPLELDGAVKPILEDPSYNKWVLYNRTDDADYVHIDMNSAVFDDEEPVISGLHYDLRGSIYTSFVNTRKMGTDEDFFLAKGDLTFDTLTRDYRIETPSKTLGETYYGSTMIYSDSSKNVIFEGPTSFFSPYTTDVTVESSVLGSGNFGENKYEVDAFLMLNFANSQSFIDLMAKDLLEIIELLGPPVANDLSIEMLYKLANITSEAQTKAYENASLKDYRPLVSISDRLIKSLVISGVKMKWSASERSWYNYTKLAISNMGEKDINAKLDGFIELKKDASNNDVLNLFIQAAPGSWYFISYSIDNLLMFSSNTTFNDEVAANSNFGKAKAGDLVLVAGEENDVLSFINNFRETYFGITDAYELSYPEELNLEDESFETIEEDTDDGFGF